MLEGFGGQGSCDNMRSYLLYPCDLPIFLLVSVRILLIFLFPSFLVEVLDRSHRYRGFAENLELRRCCLPFVRADALGEVIISAACLVFLVSSTNYLKTRLMPWINEIKNFDILCLITAYYSLMFFVAAVRLRLWT